MEFNKIIGVLMVIAIISCISADALAGRKKYFEDKMKGIEVVAVLPIDYELIVPAAMGSDKQRKGFSEEDVRDKKEKFVTSFPEKLGEYIEKRGYRFVYVNQQDQREAIDKIIHTIKGMRKNILENLGEKRETPAQVILSEEIGSWVQEIDALKDSDVFLVLLSRDRVGTGAEALTRSFGLLGQITGGESWKDEYIGYVPATNYTYVHAFAIDTDTLEVINMLASLQTGSFYQDRHILSGLANGIAEQLPKKKRNKEQ